MNEEQKNIREVLKPIVIELLQEFFDESNRKELTEEELKNLTEKQLEFYSRCHPECPNYGKPMPHTPHKPLYPTYWC